MVIGADFGMMIKAIFIDIDDTILSFQEFVKEAMREGFSAFGLKEFHDDMLPVFHGVNDALWRRIEKGEIDLDYILQNRWNMIFHELGISADGVAFEKYFRRYLFSCAIPEENADSMLKALQGKYVICAASNGPYEQQVNRLKISGMLPMFDHLFISEKIGVSKPAPLFFERAFQELNLGKEPGEQISPGETLMIGDSMSADMAGAYAYGMQTLLYDRSGNRYADNPHIDPANIDYCVRNLGDIPELLKRVLKNEQ